MRALRLHFAMKSSTFVTKSIESWYVARLQLFWCTEIVPIYNGFHGYHEKGVLGWYETKAMAHIMKTTNVLIIHNLVCKQYPVCSVFKDFQTLKFVSKLLSLWSSLSMTLDVVRSRMSTDNHATHCTDVRQRFAFAFARGMWRHWRHQGPPTWNRPCVTFLRRMWRHWRHQGPPKWNRHPLIFFRGLCMTLLISEAWENLSHRKTLWFSQ